MRECDVELRNTRYLLCCNTMISYRVGEVMCVARVTLSKGDVLEEVDWYPVEDK